MSNEYNERILALAANLEADPSEITESSHDEKTLEHGGAEYLVLTDDEADELWEESLESYIDECVLSEIPERYRLYFDGERWMSDAKTDGRGHALATYDGGEDYENINGTEYYIYRTS